MGLEQVKEGGDHAHHVDPGLRITRRAVQKLNDGELVVRVELLEVLRWEVDIYITSEVTQRTRDRCLEEISDLGVFRDAGDPTDVLIKLLVRARAAGCVLRNTARPLAGEIIDHSVPRLVIAVKLINCGNSEDHGGKERQTGGKPPG